MEIHTERGGDSTVWRVSDEKVVMGLFVFAVLFMAALMLVAIVAGRNCM